MLQLAWICRRNLTPTKSTRTMYDIDSQGPRQPFFFPALSFDFRQSRVPEAKPFSKLSRRPLNDVLDTKATCFESRSFIIPFHSPSSQKIKSDDVSLDSLVSSHTTSVRYADNVGQLFANVLSSAAGSVRALSLVDTTRLNCDEIAMCHLSFLAEQYPTPRKPGSPLST